MDLIQPGTGTRYALVAAAPNGAPPTDLLAALESTGQRSSRECEARGCGVGRGRGRGRRARATKHRGLVQQHDGPVSGAYKRRTHYVLFVLGILATIAVNADSVAVAKRLATTKTLASAVTDSARRFVDSQSAVASPLQCIIGKLCPLSIRWACRSDGPARTKQISRRGGAGGMVKLVGDALGGMAVTAWRFRSARLFGSMCSAASWWLEPPSNRMISRRANRPLEEK